MNNFVGPTAQDNDLRHRQRLESKFSTSMRSHEDVVNISSSKAVDKGRINLQQVLEEKQMEDERHAHKRGNFSSVGEAPGRSAQKASEKARRTRKLDELNDVDVFIQGALVEDITTPQYQQNCHQLT